jgi:aubergine-like protein
MNAKLGDPLWTVARPDGIPEKTMLIGIDVYNKLVDKGRKACVGIVASLDRNFSKFHSNVIIEERGAILSNKLAGNVVTAVQ